MYFGKKHYKTYFYQSQPETDFCNLDFFGISSAEGPG